MVLTQSLGICTGSSVINKSPYGRQALPYTQGKLWQNKSVNFEYNVGSFCSIYFPPFHSAEENAAYVRSVVNETVRCADGEIPIYPFHWNCEYFSTPSMHGT